jgi:hypothetical protein
MFNSILFENRSFYDIMWKNIADPGEVTDDNMAHANCMLDTYGYKHTFTISNSYCLRTATIVAQTRLKAKLYLH